MSTDFKICKSIMKKNKSFTIGLLIMSILTIAIGFFGFNIGNTSKDSLTEFINYSNLPDTLYTTELISTETTESIKEYEGVKTFESRFVFENKIELGNDKVYPARVFTYNKTGAYQLQYIKKIDEDDALINAYISIRFAREHEINVGDKLQINSPFGLIDSIVSGLVGTAEGIYPTKDFLSNQEGYSFCYIYINQDDFNKIYDITKFSNQFLLYFNDDITQNVKNELLQKIDNIFAEKLLNKKTFNNARNNLLSFGDDINSIDMVARFLSILVLIITIGFNFIFIQIIVKKESKTIGLLRALGYSKFKIVLLFCVYTILINIFASIIGIPLGYGLLRIAAYAISYNQGVVYSIINISPILTGLVVVLSFLCGIISAILSASTISKIDPSQSYGKQVEFSNEPLKITSRIKNNEFLKISITSILRNIKRQIIAALSITACITIIFTSLEGFGTCNNITESIYGKRLAYDISIRNINEETYDNIINNVGGIDILEKNIYFETELNNESIVINALEDDYQLVKLYDKNNNIVVPNDGIIIDELLALNNDLHVGDFIEIDGYSLEIDAIAREIFVPFCYISFETANKMGQTSINGLTAKVENIEQIDKIIEEIYSIDENLYLVRNTDQHSYLRDLYIQIKICLGILSALGIVIGTLLISNMSIVDFLEMKNKYATLRAIGYTPNQLTKINLIQNLSRVLVGAILALPLSYIVGNLLTASLTTNDVQFIFTKFWPFYASSVAASLIYVIIGVFVSYFNIKKLNLVEHLNANE